MLSRTPRHFFISGTFQAPRNNPKLRPPPEVKVLTGKDTPHRDLSNIINKGVNTSAFQWHKALLKLLTTVKYHLKFFCKRSLDVAQSRKFGALSDDRAHYSVKIDQARQAN